MNWHGDDNMILAGKRLWLKRKGHCVLYAIEVLSNFEYWYTRIILIDF